MISLQSQRHLRNTRTMSSDCFSTGDYFLDIDTNDAASALTFLRVINDINESPDFPGAMRYLKTVQARADKNEYVSFVGVLKEFQEDVVREINAKKDYVIKCALTLFEGHTDLILGLGDYIPEILDTLEPDSPEQRHKPPPRPPSTLLAPQEKECLIEWQQENKPHTAPQGPQLQQNPTIVSEWQQVKTEAALHWQQVEQECSEEAINMFMLKVQKRFLHSDPAVYMKISCTLQQFLVAMTMDVHKAKDDMAAVLRRHNDLWKEFERFLPPAFRSGPSDTSPPAIPL